MKIPFWGWMGETHGGGIAASVIRGDTEKEMGGVDGWTDGWMDGLVGRWTDGQAPGQAGGKRRGQGRP